MTLAVWAGTFAVFAVLMVADLALTRDTVGLRAAATSSALWIAAALAFGAALWLWRGPATAGQYFAGYLLEKALSVDNVFVFVMLFASLQVPAALQRRVLHFGVVGALVLRGGFIAAGGALIEHIGWIFYAFGALVVLAGVRMFRSGSAHEPGQNLAVRGLRRVLPITDGYAGQRFFVRLGGKRVATPLFVALVAIEVTDLVFALDSIPAVFGVTSDLFVVFTSNAFAVLGLRALYFLLAGSVDRFAYLKPGIALLLVFIGVKMLISPLVHLPVWVSLAAIAVIVGGAVAASLWRDRNRPREQPKARSRTGRCAHDRARQPAGRQHHLLRHRDHPPRPGRDPPGAAQRDRRHRARRGDRGQRRSPHRAAGGLRRGRRVPRRQPLLPARPPVRAAGRAPVLPRRQGRAAACLGRALAPAVRDAAHRRLPVRARRAHGGHAVLRHRRLPAAALRRRDRGRGHDLGGLLVFHRAAGRASLRGQALGRVAAGVRRLDRRQRPDRGDPPVTRASRRTG